MLFRKSTVRSSAVVFSSWFALLAYGCVAEPADSGEGGNNVSGTGGTGPTGGTAASGAAGTATGSGGTIAPGGAGGTTPTGGVSGSVATGGVSGAAPTGGMSGAGVTGGTAGAGVTGGAGGAPAGAGGAPVSGAGGSPAGAGGASGGSTGVNTDAMCKSISNNMPCTAAVGDGKMCPMMPCGLGDMGRRDCSCATNWTCTSCSFVGTVIETRPANADTACGTDVVNGMPCAMNVDSAASVCKSTSTTDPYCMCASDPRNSANPPEWNCDSKPGPWPM